MCISNVYILEVLMSFSKLPYQNQGTFIINVIILSIYFHKLTTNINFLHLSLLYLFSKYVGARIIQQSNNLRGG
jgi:hypothetical protein